MKQFDRTKIQEVLIKPKLNLIVDHKCECPMGCISDCAGCRYNWDENDKEELGFI